MSSAIRLYNAGALNRANYEAAATWISGSTPPFFEMRGYRKCLFTTGYVSSFIAGADLALGYKFNAADSTFYYLDGTDGPFIDVDAVGSKSSGWRDIDAAAYGVGCGVYLGVVARGGDGINTVVTSQLFIMFSES